MLAAITVLLVCQLVGEIVVVAFGLPVPGPVVGMVLLFVLSHRAPRRFRGSKQYVAWLAEAPFVAVRAGRSRCNGTPEPAWR